MTGYRLRIHGTAQTVTGSCYELRSARRRLLVDCGLFQGPRSLDALNWEPFPFPASRVDAIVDGAARVRIFGRDVAVRAHIRRIDSYSAHADRGELLQWLMARQPVRGSAFLVHGETAAIEALRSGAAEFLPSVLMPEIGEEFDLRQGAPARRLKTGRIDLRQSLSHDWQNDYADFAVNLKRQLEAIHSAEKRQEALLRMRKLLDEYGTYKVRKRHNADAGRHPPQ